MVANRHLPAAPRGPAGGARGAELGGPPPAAALAGSPQKLAEMLSSQYGLNVFVAGLLLMFAWAVHAVGVGKGHLLSFLITLMLIQLLWMLWYVGRSYAQRRLIREKDTHAGARWLRGECRPFPARAAGGPTDYSAHRLVGLPTKRRLAAKGYGLQPDRPRLRLGLRCGTRARFQMPGAGRRQLKLREQLRALSHLLCPHNS
ncbi:proton channel OTOP1 [Sarcophilus harrisii]